MAPVPPSHLLEPLPQRVAAAARLFGLMTNDVGERGLGNFAREVGNVACPIRSHLSPLLLRACDERAILQPTQNIEKFPSSHARSRSMDSIVKATTASCKRHQRTPAYSDFWDSSGEKLGFRRGRPSASVCEVSHTPPDARRDKLSLQARTRSALGRRDARMKRREVLLGLAAAVFGNVAERAIRAQAAASSLHITAVLMTPPTSSYWVAFMRRLQELGYREGENLLVEAFDGREETERLEDLKGRISKGVNVVVASGPEITLKLAIAAAGTLPIVMVAFDYDPLTLGYIKSLARPTGNITGLFVQQIEQGAKRLELIREAFPNAQTAAVLWDRLSFDQWEAVEKAAKTLGIRVIGIELHEQPYDYERALADARIEATGLLLVLASPIFFVDRERLIDCALKHRMATINPVREMTEIGGLMSYGVSLDGTMRRAAEYVDRIARGARPADLPVEQPTKFELAINLKTVKALGVAIPPSLLARADEVIE
jgi:putative tryptophan/tyrosine transport system substrate-binding protein